MTQHDVANSRWPNQAAKMEGGRTRTTQKLEARVGSHCMNKEGTTIGFPPMTRTSSTKL